MTRLDYSIAVLTGLPSHLLNRLQSMLNAAARLVCCARKYDHVTHLLRDLHWLWVPQRIQFRLAVLAFCCRNHKAPSYLADDLHWTDKAESWHRLRSGSCRRLIIPRTWLSIIGDRSFFVTRTCMEQSTYQHHNTNLFAIFKETTSNIFICQILPICLIFLLVIFVQCRRSYCSLCHVNLYVLLLLLLILLYR